MKDWEKRFYLDGWRDVARIFESPYRDDILKAQFRYLMQDKDPVEGSYLTGYADALTSAFGA